MPRASALKRAIWACVLGGFGAIIAISILTFSPFDAKGDTAGLTATMYCLTSTLIASDGLGFAAPFYDLFKRTNDTT